MGLVFLALTLLLPVVLSVPLHFHNAHDFYHGFGTKTMQFLFQKISPNDQTVKMLERLLADGRFNIQEPYNKACQLMNYSRATSLLNLTQDRKNLEILLLGPACLSPAIVKARKAFPHMWPLTGFPILVKNFRPRDLDINDIRDLLREALKQPEWWQSADWVYDINWTKMDDLHFWRMIPPTLCENSRQHYITKAFLQNMQQPTHQCLEELLMKSVRMSEFDNNWRQPLKENHLDEHTLLGKFSDLQDPWSIKVLLLLKKMYSEEWRPQHLSNALVNSGLLQYASWRDGPIDTITATNDICELFTLVIDANITDDKMEMNKQSPTLFLDEIFDWSCVRPRLIYEVIAKILDGEQGDAHIKKYVDKFLKNPNAFGISPCWLLQYSTFLQAHKYRLRLMSPLCSRFETNVSSWHLDPYTKLLQEEWRRNRINWPGMMTAHEKIMDSVRGVFKRNEDNTFDLKTDQDYNEHTWNLAFSSIKFDVEHAIPSNAVPSICLLRALLYYWRTSTTGEIMDWIKLKKAVGKKCMFPEGEKEHARYQIALEAARLYLLDGLVFLPTTNAEFLRALISREGGTMNDLTSGVIGCTLK